MCVAVGEHTPGAKARVVVGSNAWAEAQAYLRSKSGGRVSADVVLGRGGVGTLFPTHPPSAAYGWGTQKYWWVSRCIRGGTRRHSRWG